MHAAEYEEDLICQVASCSWSVWRQTKPLHWCHWWKV